MQAMECYRHINKFCTYAIYVAQTQLTSSQIDIKFYIINKYTKKVINFQIENGRILKDDLKDWIKL